MVATGSGAHDGPRVWPHEETPTSRGPSNLGLGLSRFMALLVWVCGAVLFYEFEQEPKVFVVSSRFV